MKMDFNYLNINDLSDEEIALHMRESNFEKYRSLVRMHLSFELELNEFDLPCHEIVYEDKGKWKKWNRISKKQRHHLSAVCSTTTKGSNSSGGSPTEGLHQQIDAGFLFHLKEIKEFLLLEKNITQEGIFRKTGSVSRQNELRIQIQSNKALELECSSYSAHDCATVFKGYLAELPEPVLTDAHYPAHLQLAPLCIGASYMASTSNTFKGLNTEHQKREEHLLNSIQLLLLLLPYDNRQLLMHIIDLLYAAAQQEHLNKMCAENLATLFAPHLICPRNMPPEALHYLSKKMSSIIAYMVTKGTKIFEMPAKLSTDIKAYFLERKRKKTMSPELTLDESISDISAVETVYTFVDREKTLAAHTTNTTDTELAQLYAHIQSLPESSKKRRLIKQFNRQNGQGTPLQLVVMNRIKNSDAGRSAKSLGESIKKHIFHKAMYRTPKRTNPTSTILETPNISSNKNPKLRVLFQSPAAEMKPAASTASSTCNSSTNFTHAINTHSLIKPIDSSSSHTNLNGFSKNSADGIDTLSTCSSDYSIPTISISAPVSRQTSNELPGTKALSASYTSVTGVQTENELFTDMNCCATPLKLISEAAKQLISSNINDTNNANPRKTVAWDDACLLTVEEISNPCTPAKQNNMDLKSRYKSEPNLSRILPDKITESTTNMSAISKTGLSFKRKLIKGVSMGNLKFFSTPDPTRRLVRSVSATLRKTAGDIERSDRKNLLDDIDDELDDDTFEENPNDHLDSDSEIESETDVKNELASTTSTSSELPGCSASFLHSQQNLIHRNIDLMTSTPSMFLGRRSMSPITKSTQRMPKAMQESIMTPRSRKPVMVLTNLGNSDQNQTICQTDLSSFREQDEDDSTDCEKMETHHINLHNEDAVSVGCYSDILRRKQLLLENQSFIQQGSLNIADTAARGSNNLTGENNCSSLDADALSNNFKEYLLSRSVLTASPVDSSFFSQPDDFGSTQEIEDLNESQLSASLLYCLDGNEPDRDSNSTELKVNNSNIMETDIDSMSEVCNERIGSISTNPFVILNNARKRTANKIATSTSTKTQTTATTSNLTNKENIDNTQSYIVTKKILISDYPGETSF
ncbi:uncharacterized protein LOC119683326 [Teleopsis dalmanni]|uniref:uncharacterized protein LOC119683326 n=1 Tax=Teleopsis dalmanni TaxID=139649 RepID=UPI0018CDE3BD|nr:uncharacterized protein LOC119683326 [Teleopsis dalmanni]